MNERAGFLNAICREPWEDTHRLVFADWLEENGEAERAAFIRWQCRGRFTNPYPRTSWRRWFHPWWAGRATRRHALVGEKMTLYIMKGYDIMHVTRGFVSRIDIRADDFMREAAILFDDQPVTTVRLFDIPSVAGGEGLSGWAQSSFTRHGAGTIWMRLQGWACQTQDAVRLYRSEPEAKAALSFACVAYARSLAGLPALPTRAPAAA